MMRFQASMLVTNDLNQSKVFYTELLGCSITLDLGENLTFNDAFSIQARDWWVRSINKTPEDIRYGGNDVELYFEESDFDSFLQKLAAWPDITYVMAVHQQPWGQRSVQFYDPDQHIIEVGEHMGAVVRRFRSQGMDIPEIAKRMDIPTEYAAFLETEFLS